MEEFIFLRKMIYLFYKRGENCCVAAGIMSIQKRKRKEQVKGLDKLKDIIKPEQKVSDEKISRLFSEIGKKARKLCDSIEEKRKTILQDDTFLLMATSSGMNLDLKDYARIIKYKYKVDMEPAAILKKLKYFRLDDSKKREVFYTWGEELARAFIRAVKTGNIDDANNFCRLKKIVIRRNDEKPYFVQHKYGCAVIFMKCMAWDNYDILRNIKYFSSSEGKALLNFMTDNLLAYCGQEGILGSSLSKVKLETEISKKRIAELEMEIARLNETISDLHSEFDDRLTAAKVDVAEDFFKEFNSQKWHILDSLYNSRSSVKALSKDNPSPDVKKLIALVKCLINYMQDNGIVPIEKNIHVRKTVTENDMINYNYLSNSPFADGEEKCIEIVSYGWKHNKLDFVISLPEVVEA